MKILISALMLVASSAFAADSFMIRYTEIPSEGKRLNGICTEAVGCLWAPGFEDNKVATRFRVEESGAVMAKGQNHWIQVGEVVENKVDNVSHVGWKYGRLVVRTGNGVKVSDSSTYTLWFPGFNVKTGQFFRQVRVYRDVYIHAAQGTDLETKIAFKGDEVHPRRSYVAFKKEVAVRLEDVVLTSR